MNTTLKKGLMGILKVAGTFVVTAAGTYLGKPQENRFVSFSIRQSREEKKMKFYLKTQRAMNKVIKFLLGGIVSTAFGVVAMNTFDYIVSRAKRESKN